MAKLKKLVFDVVSGEDYEVEFTDEEMAQHLIDVKRAEQASLENQEKAEAKLALLEKLGITEDEAKLLLS